jgi:uncharacterized protein YdhG (YjbR/CyaY superfamily)
MKPDHPKPTTIDDFIAQQPQEVREKLEQLRTTIRRAAPKEWGQVHSAKFCVLH